MNEVAARLAEKQRDLGVSDGQFAATLGVTRTRWNGVKNGRADPGYKLIRGALKAFPELAPLVAQAMTREPSEAAA